MAVGRPSKYSQALADKICESLSLGRSLREICEADDMPAKSSVMKWLSEKPEFSDQYARAREAQADYLAEELLEIADDGTNDWMLRNKGSEDETEVANHEHIARSRLRVDARKWLMSKMAPKKYGDKITTQVEGNPDRPLHTVNRIEVIIVDPKA